MLSLEKILFGSRSVLHLGSRQLVSCFFMVLEFNMILNHLN